MANLTEQQKAVLRWLLGPAEWCPKCRAGVALPHRHERDDGKEYKPYASTRSAKQVGQNGKKGKKTASQNKRSARKNALMSTAETKPHTP